mmetsp:Transcript_66809/g.179899  ORF Transcript_66809/g.179899 Transcript_66809/m.179899 type:complete len:450 (-) Transcript_66809:38-1387(-)
MVSPEEERAIVEALFTASDTDVFTGIVTRAGGKFGFIACPEVKVLYNEDVFCPGGQLQGINVGDSVEFELFMSPQGKPQATNVRQAGGLLQEEEGLGRNVGTIKAMRDKFAFIDCPEVKASHGMDVFCPAAAVQGCSVGDVVEFGLVFNSKGQPQAQNVSFKEYGDGGQYFGGCGSGGGGGGGHSGFCGAIKVIGPKFGFIHCPYVTAQYGSDVFAPATAMAGMSVGDSVDFELKINDRGQPQASNLRLGMQWGGKQSFGGGVAGGKGKGKGRVGDGGPVFVGTISALGPKFGFIDCPQVEAQYGSGVSVPSVALCGFSVGDMIDFELTVSDQGQPQTYSVKPHSGDNQFAAPQPVVSAGKGGPTVPQPRTIGEKFGSIKTIGEKFGLISCPEVKAEYGRDVFCPAIALRGFAVGDAMAFDLQVSEKGQLQAANIRAQGGGGIKRPFVG